MPKISEKRADDILDIKDEILKMTAEREEIFKQIQTAKAKHFKRNLLYRRRLGEIQKKIEEDVEKFRKLNEAIERCKNAIVNIITEEIIKG